MLKSMILAAITMVALSTLSSPAQAQDASTERCGVTVGTLQSTGEAPRLRQELRAYVYARICSESTPPCPEWVPAGGLLCRTDWGQQDGGFWYMNSNVQVVGGNTGTMYRLRWKRAEAPAPTT